MLMEDKTPTLSALSAAAIIAIATLEASNKDVSTASRIPVGSNGISLLVTATANAAPTIMTHPSASDSSQPMASPQITLDEARGKPTFVRWLNLADGKILKYANYDYIKGGDDEKQVEEKLLKRIIQVANQNKKDDRGCTKKTYKSR